MKPDGKKIVREVNQFRVSYPQLDKTAFPIYNPKRHFPLIPPKATK
jgi:hypothetical protein